MKTRGSRRLGVRLRFLWRSLFQSPDVTWTILWLAGLTLVWIWLSLFLNEPARLLVRTAFIHTLTGAAIVVVTALLLGWQTGLILHAL